MQGNAVATLGPEKQGRSLLDTLLECPFATEIHGDLGNFKDYLPAPD